MNTQPISELMTRDIHHIEVNGSVIEARNMMDKYEINHLPVLQHGELVGILSRNDINQINYLLDFIGQKLDEQVLFKSLSIEELMTEQVQTLDANASTFEAIQIFSMYSFQCLPIMENGELVCIVTSKDLFASMLTTA